MALLAWLVVSTTALGQMNYPEQTSPPDYSVQGPPGYQPQPAYPQQAPQMYEQAPAQPPQGYPQQPMYGPPAQPAPGYPQQPMYPPQGQPPPQAPAQAPPQGQQPATYAFRPNLSNPEYGECLQIERQWKDLWNQYYQQYENYRRWGYADPNQAGIWQHHLSSLRQQLDQAWQNFSGRCIYFPRPRQQ